MVAATRQSAPPGFMVPVDIEPSSPGAQRFEANPPGFMATLPTHTLNTLNDYKEYFITEMKHPTFAQSVIAEWWATTLFLFFLILSCLPGANDGQEVFRIGIVAGLTIAILVYAFYAVSGGNINPAVSLGLALSGRMTAPRACFYIAAQIVGAITGTAMAKAVSPRAFDLGKGGMNALQTLDVDLESIAITEGQAFFAEVMGSMLLVLAVLFCTDTARSIEHPHMTALIPLEIGFVVLLAHVAMIPIDGCGINPARSIGSAAIYGSLVHLWIFVWGPVVGACFAALIYRLIFAPTEVFNEYFKPENVMARASKGLRTLSGQDRGSN
ncbi:plasma membrane intrinsic protein [Nannochloropsis gaditana]|uniref:Plasma membrane intrinsic protein n=1 Tax=Nannochloropsis gaditana TaxID=72520 RepID=W7T6A2_9STRA|nr:plasma membrane intrinsic protein [Nannochloropsis gaditana]